MLACTSLFRVNFISKSFLYFQAVSCDSMMKGRKRRIDLGPQKQQNVTQIWRAVSTQPNRGGEGSNDDMSLDENFVRSEKHSVPMEVGRSLMRFIKRKGTQKEIERETGVKISLPSSKTEDFILIEGNSAESVSKASEKIKTVIDNAVNSHDLTYSHFVSLPLAIHPGLVDKLVDFQNKILEMAAASDEDANLEREKDENEENQKSTRASEVVELKAEKDGAYVPVARDMTSDTVSSDMASDTVASDMACDNVASNMACDTVASDMASDTPDLKASSSKPKDSGIEKSIFIKPKAFHLTILVLKLWNKDRVKAAEEVLRSVSSKVMDALENKPVSIRLKGLDIMKGSLSKAQVLYVPVEEIGDEGRLLRACEVIIAAFVEAGLVIENDVQHKLKLHASVMNARHRRWEKGSKKLRLFNARGIFDLYGSEEWGEYPIREAHLSQRFAYDENGYYHCCASIPFPDDEMHVN